MSLSVIGAGMGRTGTDSMREALNVLGFGPCHHMHELSGNPEQRRLWRSLANGAEPNWGQLLEGYRSTVDWPSAYYWRELAAVYPEAKVLLTTRSSETWLASMQKTIFEVLRNNTDPESIGAAVVFERVFGGRIDDPAHVVEVYERHHAEVLDVIPAERLLVYQLGDGWKPLCDFLDVAVPEVPFPRRNSASDFNSVVDVQRSRSGPSSPFVTEAVAGVLDGLPDDACGALLRLRALIQDVHTSIDDGDSLEETLKWGAPSYRRRGGSTVRLGWSPREPSEYRLYFHCQSSLIPTFRELYPDVFRFEGKRAIVFTLGDPVPEDAVRHCVELALRYHKLKHLPLLGC